MSGTVSAVIAFPPTEGRRPSRYHPRCWTNALLYQLDALATSHAAATVLTPGGRSGDGRSGLERARRNEKRFEWIGCANTASVAAAHSRAPPGNRDNGYRHGQVVQRHQGIRLHSTRWRREGRLRPH